MKRKNRIVVRLVDVEYHSTITGKNSIIPVYQEVYSSWYHKDCVSYINRQTHPKQYKIYVEDK